MTGYGTNSYQIKSKQIIGENYIYTKMSTRIFA